ncbi:ankyrin repeat domain-containing protein [bacterium]|nr:MAG: ankyrin repeat domain-containing protein [bacterium]
MNKKCLALLLLTLSLTTNALPAAYGEVRASDPGVTKIHVAAAQGNYWYLHFNLTSDNINLPDGTGSTPLFYAVENGQIGSTVHLIDYDADVHARNKGGATPLHYAVFGNSPMCFRLLIEQGADVNALDENKATPLHIFASLETPQESAEERQKELECIQILLANGADIKLKTVFDKTVFDLAKESGRDDITALLKKYTKKRIAALKQKLDQLEQKEQAEKQNKKQIAGEIAAYKKV